MADVVLSGAMRSNLLSMQNTAKLLDQTQQRVATGLKVNSAIDNPQSYFTAQGLDNRASDLGSLLDNMGLAVQTLKAASQGIDAIQKLVQQAKATAVQALQTTIEPTTLKQTIPTTFPITNSTISVQVGDHAAISIPLTAAGATDATSLAAAITADTGAVAEGVSAVANDDGTITISAASGQTLEISGTDATTLKLAGTADNGVNRNAQVDTYNALLDQINQLASDSSFNGINLLQKDSTLVVNFNETQSSKLTLTGVDSSFSGLGLSKISYDAFATTDALKEVQGIDDKSINQLRVNSTAFASSLSIVQSRQDFTNNLINTLKTGSGNLTLADTNEEGANLLSLQTRQQLGTSALSIANQSQQSILKLF